MTISDEAHKAALRRLGQLKHFWINFTQTLEEMIEKRDHEALGYSTFTEMWAAHMSELPLAGQFLIQVVYRMLDEGSPIEDIAEAVSGAAEESVEFIARQKSNHVPPEAASSRDPKRKPSPSGDKIIVPEHEREYPSDPDTMHITLGQLGLKRHLRMAKKLHMSAGEYGRAALDYFYDQMADIRPDQGEDQQHEAR